MIRKFNLTNGVSVVITEELAVKYELDTALNDADFVSMSFVYDPDKKWMSVFVPALSLLSPVSRNDQLPLGRRGKLWN